MVKKITPLFCSLIALAGFFFFHVTFASAATYYVSKTGSDSGDGSVGSPWLTLQKAEDTATDNDIVNVAAGTYVENNVSTHGWRVAKGITWNASGTVIVKGSPTGVPLVVTGLTTAVYNGFTFDAENTLTFAVRFSTSQNKTFTNCTFLNGTTSLITLSNIASTITFSNSTFTTNGIPVFSSATGVTGINVTGSTINLNGASTIVTVAGTNSFTLDGNTINLASTTSVVTVGGSSTFSFINNTISGTPTSMIVGTSTTATGTIDIKNNTVTLDGTPTNLFYTAGGSGTLTIDGNTLTLNSANSSGRVIYVKNGSWATRVTNNTITVKEAAPVREVIRISDQQSPIITGNTIETFTSATLPQIYIASTIASTPLGTVTISNNILKSRSSSGYVIAIGSETTTVGDNMIESIIEHNTIYGPYYYDAHSASPTTHAIFVGFNINSSIRYNTIYGEGYGVVVKGKGTGSVYTSGGILYNTIINSNQVAGIRIKGIQHLMVANNTIYNDLSTGARAIHVSENVAGDSAANTTLNNNILSDSSNTVSLIVVDPISQSNFVTDNNIFYAPSSNHVGMIATSDTLESDYQYLSLSQWQNLGYDVHSQFANPVFVNGSTKDLALQSTSPAIDMGVAVAGNTTDILGHSFYGPVDAGAYEYQPQFTMGTDRVSTTAAVRTYGNEKYGYTEASTGSDTASFAIQIPGSDVTQYVDTKITSWDTTGIRHQQWKETGSSSGVTNTVHIIGDLQTNTSYNVKVDGTIGQNITGGTCTAGVCLSDGTGKITFTYTGSYASAHTFDVRPTGVPPVISAIAVSTTPTSAGITWTTDENTDAKVEYGITSTSQYSPVTDATQTTTHSITLSGLNAGTEYRYTITSVDEAGVASTTAEQTFITIASSQGYVSGGGGPVLSQLPPAQSCRPGDRFSAITGQPCPTSGTIPSGTLPALLLETNFYSGVTNTVIKDMQHYLNTHGFPVAVTSAGSPGKETTFFGPATKAALKKFQLKNTILPATGGWGPQTRAFVSTHL